ncbi:hypothetical protein FJY70_04600 [candidate division WOR-3 bacterium]|nr:hypothetical protein [candidate division WOR-3 bacterium]
MTQHCSEEILSAYLDGDLGVEESGRTAEHLAECPVCRSVLAQVRYIRDAATVLEEASPSDRVWAAIQARIGGRYTSRVRRARILWFGVPALAAALLFVAFAGGLGPATRDALLGVAHPRGAPERTLTAEAAAEETVRDYDEYLKGIDRALDECRAALNENPGNARVRAAYAGARLDRSRALDQLVAGGD